jgi:hypothetical protein
MGRPARSWRRRWPATSLRLRGLRRLGAASRPSLRTWSSGRPSLRRTGPSSSAGRRARRAGSGSRARSASARARPSPTSAASASRRSSWPSRKATSSSSSRTSANSRITGSTSRNCRSSWRHSGSDRSRTTIPHRLLAAGPCSRAQGSVRNKGSLLNSLGKSKKSKRGGRGSSRRLRTAIPGM